MKRGLKVIGLSAYTTAHRYKEYPIEFFFGFFARFVGVALLTYFWFMVGQYSDLTTDTKQLVGYYLIVSGAMVILLTDWQLAHNIKRHIKFGQINPILMKPVHPLFIFYGIQFGSSLPFVILSIINITIGTILASSHSLNPFVIVLGLVNAVIINICLNVLVGCLAFFFVEASGMINTANHISRLLQGMLIPLYLTPLWLQNATHVLPFGASLFLPVQALMGKDIPTWHLVSGTIWSMVLMFLALVVWRRSMRRYEGVGI